MLPGLRLLAQPVKGPTNEVSGEEHTAFLEINRRFGANFDFVQVEDLFAFLDSCFNELPAVVMVEPGGQILSDQIRTVMEQGAVLKRGAGVKAFQGQIQRIRRKWQGTLGPGRHFGISADSSEERWFCDLAPERVGQALAGGFGINFVAHFGQ